MKKEYQKPMVEMIEFVPDDDIMNDEIDGDEGFIGEGDSGSVEDW